MQVNVEKLSPVLVEFQIEVPAAQVRSEVDKAYVVLQRSAKVKGFRPGKAPLNVLAHLYGGRIHADVAQRLVDSTLNQALSDKQVQPLSQPAIAPSELKPAEAFTYKARFEVRPEIDVVNWEGFEVTRPAVLASEAAIDAEIVRLRREHSTLQTPDPERPAKKGDAATMTFTLEVDAASASGDKPQEIETEIGAGEVFKEIDEALEGMSPAGHKDVEIVFSDRHVNQEFRGKKGIFHITLKDLKERILPEVDAEFAKDCGADDLAALRVSLKEKIEKDLKQKASDNLAEQLVAELCKANPIPVPPSLVEQQSRMTQQELVTAARRQGQRLDSSPELNARVRADSEMKVRAGLVMAEIARIKQVQVTEQDIEKGYLELAEQTGKNVAKVKAEYRDAKKREMLIGMILEDKILDLVEGAAKITETESAS